MQIPFHVDSGNLPRKVEVERRKREFAELADDFDSLLGQLDVDSQVKASVYSQRVDLHHFMDSYVYV